MVFMAVFLGIHWGFWGDINYRQPLQKMKYKDPQNELLGDPDFITFEMTHFFNLIAT
jgi:hypothetical protein